MNRTLPTLLLAVVAALTHGLPTAQEAIAQMSGYQSPSFYSASMQGAQSMPPLPAAPLPASPLAGGLPAAQGGSYMDAHGQAIVMPASYCQSCRSTGSYCESCPGSFGPGSYGDPMAIDFGGYAADQCGPHYFDVSFGTVFLQGEDFFKGVLPFTTSGVGDPRRFLNPAADFAEYEPGWQVALRYDLGPLSLVEATYMGIYDISYRDQVNSPDVSNPPGSNFTLFSVYSTYGTAEADYIDGIEFGQTHRVDYKADLQSTEFSYRRYWVGKHPRVSGTWLLGARYLRFTDDFAFNSVALVNANPNETASLLWSGENDLVGFQLGADGWICLRQGLRVGCEGKAGIYNNRFKFRQAGTFSASSAPDDFDVPTKDNQIAFAAEGEASIVADILPSWSIRGGYRVLFLNSLVTAENNIDQTDIASTTVLTQAGLLMHGFHGGVEYVW